MRYAANRQNTLLFSNPDRYLGIKALARIRFNDEKHRIARERSARSRVQGVLETKEIEIQVEPGTLTRNRLSKSWIALLNFTSSSEIEVLKLLWKQGYLLMDDFVTLGVSNNNSPNSLGNRLTVARFAVRGKIRFVEKKKEGVLPCQETRA